jgi:hypothetical protein
MMRQFRTAPWLPVLARVSVWEGKEIYNCIGSLNCCLLEDIFINGFNNALINIKKDYNDFTYIMIENIRKTLKQLQKNKET